MSRNSRSSAHTEPDTIVESRPWTACSSTTGSRGDMTSRSSRASKSNLISSISDGDLPALPPYAWKRRSVRRSSYDYKHMSVGLPEKEAADLKTDLKRHSLRMTPPPTTTIAFSHMDSPEAEHPPVPALGRPLERFAAPISSRQKSK